MAKTFRLVEEDVDHDGRNDLTFTIGNKPAMTVYDWRSMFLSWVATTTSLFVAGLGILQFW